MTPLQSRRFLGLISNPGKSPSVHFNLDRGRYLSFEGSYKYKKGALKAVEAYAPKDEKLHQIVKSLQDIQRVNFYQLRAACSHGRERLRVSAERYDDKELTEGADDHVQELLNDFAHWILNRLENEVDYLSSEECLIERAEANGYEFDENGREI
jgi:hypothetical protein